MQTTTAIRPKLAGRTAFDPAASWCSGREGDSAAPQTRPYADPGAEASPFRVLIVEDEVLIAMSLESLVEDFGFEVCGVAVTGEDAIRQALSTKPDLVLMDVALAGQMDGIEAARQVREALGANIIFLTAYGAPGTLERIRSTVPSAPVVQKPVTSAALLGVIRKSAPRAS